MRYVEAATVGHPARRSWNEIETKTRRMVGGQVLAGSPLRRLYRMLRILAPPLIRCLQIAVSVRAGNHRWSALGVQLRVWTAGVGELLRLMTGGGPERR